MVVSGVWEGGIQCLPLRPEAESAGWRMRQWGCGVSLQHPDYSWRCTAQWQGLWDCWWCHSDKASETQYDTKTRYFYTQPDITCYSVKPDAQKPYKTRCSQLTWCLLHRTIWELAFRSYLEQGRPFQKVFGRWWDKQSDYDCLSTRQIRSLNHMTDIKGVQCNLPSLETLKRYHCKVKMKADSATARFILLSKMSSEPFL